MTVGERIKQQRIELGLSQEALAKRMGYKNKSAICRVEKDYEQNLTLDRVEMFAKALSVEPAFLMGWKEPQNTTFIYTDEMLDFDLKFKQLTRENQKNVLQYIDYLLSTQNDDHKQQ